MMSSPQAVPRLSPKNGAQSGVAIGPNSSPFRLACPRGRAIPATIFVVVMAAIAAHVVVPRAKVSEPISLDGMQDPGVVYDVPITVLTEADDEAHREGVCLDGSPPAYHFSPGWGEGATKWLVFLEGGGWCTSLADCWRRAHTQLGSSVYMRRTFRFSAILSNSSSRNPYFYDWNIAYVRYCDGASFAGAAGEVTYDAYDANPGEDGEDAGGGLGVRDAQGGVLHFQGQAVFRRVISRLLKAHGMQDASHALLAGCSAGGLAALLHCQMFQEIMQALPPLSSSSIKGNGTSSRTVKCLSDGGLFLDAVDAFGGREMNDMYSAVVALQKPVMSAECVNQSEEKPVEPSKPIAASADARCFFPENFLQHGSTPVYLLNALYDNWCIDFAFVPIRKDTDGAWGTCRRDLSKCSEQQLNVLHGFRDQVVQNAEKILAGKNEGQDKGRPHSGAFLLGCHIHCQALWSNTWHGPSSPRVRGKTIAEAVGQWFTEIEPSETTLIDCKFPCNPTCFQWWTRR